ncbi:MAG: NAD(+)--rifampin ADP-ribosyltransferase [Gemmatimonadetes bacterium]|nr:NAD(+)--rifampin ADP-ribosyltransferase [Gemmatimonadota bacterium]
MHVVLPSGPFYHGTKADLRSGDLIRPGHRSNYGDAARTSPWVYMTAMRSALGAELARGDGPGRLYIVEPTGPIFDDPDLTDKKFPGNPTRSYRSRHPLRVLGEVTDWVPSPPEMIRAIQEGQTRLYEMQAARIARIPDAEALARLERWVAVIESCVTEIGLSVETRIVVTPAAADDTLRFRVEADGPERSWQRALRLVRGVLSDDEHGEIWDFGAATGAG